MWVCQCTSGACSAHLCDVGVHARPIKAKTDAMEGAIRVKMRSDGVSMKSNKDNVAKLRWDELQASVRFGPDDHLPIYQNTIFERDERLAQSRTIIGVEVEFLK